jgi:hypothetical protein
MLQQKTIASRDEFSRKYSNEELYRIGDKTASQDSQLSILLPPCLSIALKSSIVDQIDTKNAHSNPQTQHLTSRRKR